MCQAKSFCLWLLQVIGLLGLLALCLWLVLRPRNPNYPIVNFSVPAINDSNATDPGMIIQYALDIDNPNKDLGIDYDDTFLIFYHGTDTVGNNTIPSFYQGRDRNRRVLDHFDVDTQFWAALRSAILNSTAECQLGSNIKHGALKLSTMNYTGKERYRLVKMGRYRTRRRELNFGMHQKMETKGYPISVKHC